MTKLGGTWEVLPFALERSSPEGDDPVGTKWSCVRGRRRAVVDSSGALGQNANLLVGEMAPPPLDGRGAPEGRGGRNGMKAVNC